MIDAPAVVAKLRLFPRRTLLLIYFITILIRFHFLKSFRRLFPPPRRRRSIFFHLTFYFIYFFLYLGHFIGIVVALSSLTV